MKLEETVALMTSKDYKDKFRAEYWQLNERYTELDQMIIKWDDGKLDFTPTCPKEMLIEQLEYMQSYLALLERRAELEGVKL